MIRCPKCDSDDVLVGSGSNPNRCSDCDHKWDVEGPDHKCDADKQESFSRKLSETLSKL